MSRDFPFHKALFTIFGETTKIRLNTYKVKVKIVQTLFKSHSRPCSQPSSNPPRPPVSPSRSRPLPPSASESFS